MIIRENYIFRYNYISILKHELKIIMYLDFTVLSYVTLWLHNIPMIIV